MNESDRFINALENHDLCEIKKVPKSDLHNHAPRGGNLKFIENWAGVKIPRLETRFKDLSEMQKWYTENVKIYCPGISGYEKRLEAAFFQAREDGIKVLGMSFGFEESSLYNNSVEKWINAISRMHMDIAAETIFIPELAFSRGISCDKALGQLEIVSQYDYFKSIDINGDEFAAPITDYKKLYKKAKEKGFILKAHVGEFGVAESVREAVEELELDEIHHGISAATSKSVMRFLEVNKIQLNVCPTSNILLSIIENYKVHPVRQLYDNGVSVTINTDDMLIFNQSVSEEFYNLYRSGLLSARELDEIRENGVLR